MWQCSLTITLSSAVSVLMLWLLGILQYEIRWREVKWWRSDKEVVYFCKLRCEKSGLKPDLVSLYIIISNIL